MTSEFSKSQINRLGERLRKDQHQQSDLELLDAFRTSFGDAQESVIRTQRDLGLDPTGRIAKTTPSIIAKLKRGSISLPSIQDIAGCRVIVDSIAEQKRVAGLVIGAFPASKVVDRRAKPSHGYRAIHVIVKMDEKRVEIQIRTELQHLWARLSEGWADAAGQSIKYGGGPSEIQAILQIHSELVAETEAQEHALSTRFTQGVKESLNREILRISTGEQTP